MTKFWSTLLLHQILVKFIVSHHTMPKDVLIAPLQQKQSLIDLG